MDRIQVTVTYLNPSQDPVIAADQPIYAKFVIMFGGLHTEMAALKSIGTLLPTQWMDRGSGGGRYILIWKSRVVLVSFKCH